jgi:hypothetical protein
MKLTTRQWVWGVVAAGAVLAVVLAPDEPAVDSTAIVGPAVGPMAGPGRSNQARPASVEPKSSQRAALAEREPIALPNSDPFDPRLPPPAVPMPQVVSVAPLAPPPEAPSMPYQFMGRVQGVDGKVTVFLSRENRLVMVKAGDTLEGQYYINRIDADGIDVTYLPMEKLQRVAIPMYHGSTGGS